MNIVPYSVSIVVDRKFGPKLRKLFESGPVWIVDSPSNRESAQDLWKTFPSHGHLDGITVFDASSDRSAEQMLFDEFATIDLHHGEHSADPPYTVVRVFGTASTAKIEGYLSEYGFASFNATQEGFQAIRPLPAKPSR
ncbi:MAG TPA: hypothetical protein VHX60_06960 [Acidobacteriaceae bacterium]|nr:hypothetical protein [Acidobacteriaceae bacterium]